LVDSRGVGQHRGLVHAIWGRVIAAHYVGHARRVGGRFNAINVDFLKKVDVAYDCAQFIVEARSFVLSQRDASEGRDLIHIYIMRLGVTHGQSLSSVSFLIHGANLRFCRASFYVTGGNCLQVCSQ
jgi:hypothetical protein